MQMPYRNPAGNPGCQGRQELPLGFFQAEQGDKTLASIHPQPGHQSEHDTEARHPGVDASWSH